MKEKLLLQYLAAEKPPGVVRAVDVLLVAHMITVSDAQMRSSLSHEELARRSGVQHISTIMESLKRLLAVEWITKESGKKGFRANTYTVMLDHIPKKELVTVAVTAEAKRLALWYYQNLRNLYGKRVSKSGRTYTRPIQKDWRQRWSFIMQFWLNQGYTEMEVGTVLHHAFKTRPRDVVRGAQALRKYWKNLVREALPQRTVPAVQAESAPSE